MKYFRTRNKRAVVFPDTSNGSHRLSASSRVLVCVCVCNTRFSPARARATRALVCFMRETAAAKRRHDMHPPVDLIFKSASEICRFWHINTRGCSCTDSPLRVVRSISHDLFGALLPGPGEVYPRRNLHSRVQFSVRLV